MDANVVERTVQEAGGAETRSCTEEEITSRHVRSHWYGITIEPTVDIERIATAGSNTPTYCVLKDPDFGLGTLPAWLGGNTDA
jgi:hypothetical protein